MQLPAVRNSDAFVERLAVSRDLWPAGTLALWTRGEDAPLPERVAAQRLIHEHEMGELFKVLGLARGIELDALGFASGDRSHRL